MYYQFIKNVEFLNFKNKSYTSEHEVRKTSFIQGQCSIEDT